MCNALLLREPDFRPEGSGGGQEQSIEQTNDSPQCYVSDDSDMGRGVCDSLLTVQTTPDNAGRVDLAFSIVLHKCRLVRDDRAVPPAYYVDRCYPAASTRERRQYVHISVDTTPFAGCGTGVITLRGVAEGVDPVTGQRTSNSSLHPRDFLRLAVVPDAPGAARIRIRAGDAEFYLTEREGPHFRLSDLPDYERYIRDNTTVILPVMSLLFRFGFRLSQEHDYFPRDWKMLARIPAEIVSDGHMSAQGLCSTREERFVTVAIELGRPLHRSSSSESSGEGEGGQANDGGGNAVALLETTDGAGFLGIKPELIPIACGIASFLILTTVMLVCYWQRITRCCCRDGGSAAKKKKKPAGRSARRERGAREPLLSGRRTGDGDANFTSALFFNCTLNS
jgi:hypothetical protein